MSEIDMPFPLKGVPIKPEMKGRVKLDEVMIQTLSALCGYDGEARRLLTCSLNGSLNTASPGIDLFGHETGSGANDVITFGDIPTTEVIIRGHPDNTGLVWVTKGVTPTANNAWPLAGNDHIILSVNNMRDLQVLIVVSGEKVIWGRTV